jgi:pyruvate kinase
VKAHVWKQCSALSALLARRHLNIRGKSANLPAITDKDWLDLKFGIDVGVDYYALSFVRNADVIYELKSYLAKHGARLLACQTGMLSTASRAIQGDRFATVY